MTYPIDPRLSTLTVRELPVGRKQQLSGYLNVEQVIPAECGLARDYRGLAQQASLPHSELAKLEKLPDPTGSLLTFHTVAKMTVFSLCEILLQIGRFDVLDDMIPVILEDLKTLQPQAKKDAISYAIPRDETIWYDAYVCYADSDLEFVKQLAKYLEDDRGFRLFIRDRDLIGGEWIYATFARLIETQCRRMIIVLSPDFLRCPECNFQTEFATGLSIDKRVRILVPVILKHCDLPAILQQLSKIDLSGSAQSVNPDWSWRRLVMSIQADHQRSGFAAPTRPAILPATPEISEPFPPPPPSLPPTPVIQEVMELQTVQQPHPLQTNVSVISNASASSTASSMDHGEMTQLIDLEDRLPPVPETPPGTSSGLKKHSSNWLKTIKRKIKVAL